MREGILPLPVDVRQQLNMNLGDRELASLDNDARFIVRRAVARAYSRGFDDGWMAGQDDARTDRSIERDWEAKDA